MIQQSQYIKSFFFFFFILCCHFNQSVLCSHVKKWLFVFVGCVCVGGGWGRDWDYVDDFHLNYSFCVCVVYHDSVWSFVLGWKQWNRPFPYFTNYSLLPQGALKLNSELNHIVSFCLCRHFAQRSVLIGAHWSSVFTNRPMLPSTLALTWKKWSNYPQARMLTTGLLSMVSPSV